MTHAGHGYPVGALLLVLALAVGYEMLSLRRSWSTWRGASFMVGCALLTLRRPGVTPSASDSVSSTI